jgi:hypothetical protein
MDCTSRVVSAVVSIQFIVHFWFRLDLVHGGLDLALFLFDLIYWGFDLMSDGVDALYL